MDQSSSNRPTGRSEYPETMPVLFVGHGTPMNAIEDNIFSRGWREAAKILPRPKAILCISAHWETEGTWVTGMDSPRTIHDFGGFPRELYQVQYPAPGSRWLALETKKNLDNIDVKLDGSWGLDHGCWSVLRQMFPSADIPVVQLSLDYTLPAPEHYALADGLRSLRHKGILIIGSGNMVHNLGLIEVRGSGLGDFNKPFGFDWALEANEQFKSLIDENRFQKLADYTSLGRAARLAIPTNEHFLPLLYALALKQENESILYFNDLPVGGSLTMTSIIIEEVSKNREYSKIVGARGA